MMLPFQFHSQVGGAGKITWSSHIGRKVTGFTLLFVAGTVALFMGRLSGGEWATFMAGIYAVFSAAVAYEKGKANNG
jgi:hypothetical protein